MENVLKKYPMSKKPYRTHPALGIIHHPTHCTPQIEKNSCQTLHVRHDSSGSAIVKVRRKSRSLSASRLISVFRQTRRSRQVSVWTNRITLLAGVKIKMASALEIFAVCGMKWAEITRSKTVGVLFVVVALRYVEFIKIVFGLVNVVGIDIYLCGGSRYCSCIFYLQLPNSAERLET